MEGLSYKACVLCPRRCGVNRARNVGFCGESDKVYLARAALHFWEEPVISGSAGSGAVFFRGCGLKCVYCQNFNISRGAGGKEVSCARLSEIYLELQKKGAANINLVTPTHFLPHTVKSVKSAREAGLTVPVVYNTSGYELPEVIEALRGTADVFLTDFKYFLPDTGRKYSSAPDYFSCASAALERMVALCPKIEISSGLMKKGVIVRHLLLPGHLIESKMIVKYLFEKYGNSICYSLMNQYTPVRKIGAYPNLNRTVTEREYDSLISYACRLGITNAFIQEGGTQKESFIPEFDLTGIQ